MSAKWSSTPAQASYDVVIVGGAMFGSSVAWFLADNPDFDGSVLVVEKDPSYEQSATAHTNSCMRQQFSNEVNVRVSQFAADFVKNFQSYMHHDPLAPELHIQNYGYMYLADNEHFAQSLRDAHKVQVRCGAGTKLLTPDEIRRDYPFYHLDDIVLGSHNLVDEGYWDCVAVFDGWRRSARAQGVEFVANEVVAMTRSTSGRRVEQVTLASGERISCGTVVNASGPRAVKTSRMAGIELPVEPRKRYTFIYAAAQPLDRDLPLTIDPSGIHMRTDGQHYLAGCAPDADLDVAVAYDDFAQDHSLWEDKVWPVLANRIPQFEAIKLLNSWVGHYSYNTFDHNAILGAHSKVENFLFVNGFSGHGLQQSPAMGRGTAELITYGEYRALDLSAFNYSRIEKNEPLIEKAVI